MKNIEKLFDIIDRSIFTIDPPLDYHRTTLAIIKLANMVHAHGGDSDDLWAIGECGNCDLASLLIGAYWHYSEWHTGQCSDSYRALCAIGQVFSPGMTNGPEEGSSEWGAYNQLAELAQATNPV